MNYYKRHLGDYARDTGHLSLIEHGAYNRLIDLYYVRDGDLPGLTAIFRLLRAASKEEQAVISAILAEFFQADDDGLWHHKRCDAEIHACKAKAQANQRNGKAGGRPPKNPVHQKQEPTNNPDGFLKEPTAEPTQNPRITLAISHKPLAITKTLNPCASGDARFETFWQGYPRKKSKATAIKAWNRLHPSVQLHALIMDGLSRAKGCRDWTKEHGEYIPYPASWLNARGWEDELELPQDRERLVI